MPNRNHILQSTDIPFHVCNRGVDRGNLFFADINYQYFLQLLVESLEGASVQLLVYALMPNHFHLILEQTREFAISWYMKKVCWRYSMNLNRQRNRAGHSFEGRFVARQIIDDGTLLRVSHYIHSNPVRAGLVNDALDWKYSSVRGYTQELPLCHLNVSRILSLVDGRRNYRRFMKVYDPSQPDSVQWFLRGNGPEAGPAPDTLNAFPGAMNMHLTISPEVRGISI